MIGLLQPGTALARELRVSIDGDVIAEPAVLTAYSRDASPYCQQPLLVVRPRHRDDCVQLVRFAAAKGLALIPRAGGTSLAGQCVGDGVVVDTGFYMNGLRGLDTGARLATVEPGMVCNGLNRLLAPHGLAFAPDPSSAARCRIGGMIGNNAWGLHAVSQGTTREHIAAVEVVPAGSGPLRMHRLDNEALEAKRRRSDREGEIYRAVFAIVDGNLERIRTCYPGFRNVTSNAGYALDALARQQPWCAEGSGFDLGALLCGAEGTLGLITEATVKLSPPPRHRRMLSVQFDCAARALGAVPAILSTAPAALEWLDGDILETAGRDVRRSVLSIATDRPLSILLIEYAGEERAQVDHAAAEGLRVLESAPAYRSSATLVGEGIERAWDLRRAALAMLMETPGGLRAVTGVEDTAVRIGDLAAYYEELKALFDARGLKVYAYGPVGMGTMHLRPVFTGDTAGAVDAYVALIEDVAAVTARYRGSFSAKHGDGRMRGAFLAATLGEEMIGVLKSVKHTFDPAGIFNPGKILDCPPLRAAFKPFPGS